jgi:hypothetical protein
MIRKCYEEEDKIVYVHRKDAKIAERESFLICPEYFSGQIKKFSAFQPYLWLKAWVVWRIGLSPILQKKIPSLSVLCASNESSVKDEWAVKFCVIYLVLLLTKGKLHILSLTSALRNSAHIPLD